MCVCLCVCVYATYNIIANVIYINLHVTISYKYVKYWQEMQIQSRSNLRTYSSKHLQQNLKLNKHFQNPAET